MKSRSTFSEHFMTAPYPRAGWLAPFCAVGLLLPVISHWLAGSRPTLEWLIDLPANWQWLFLAGLIIAIVTGVRTSLHWAWLLLLMPLPWITASPRAPIVAEGTAAGHARFTVASANVHLDNGDPSRLFAWLYANKPDVVVLNEVTSTYAKGLEVLTGYPYRLVLTHDSPFGIALLSRHPFAQVQSIPDPNDIPRISATLAWNGSSIGLIALHPMPPITPRDHMARNTLLRELAMQAGMARHPVILIGDLNATPWSNAFSGLDRAGLIRANDLTPTWPTALRGLMGIPIDHVLVTRHWSVVSSQAGDSIGSDHYPLLAILALTAK